MMRGQDLKEQLGYLRKLQENDLQLDGFTSQKNAIQERLDENRSFLQKLEEDLEMQKSKLEEIRQLQTSKRDDLRSTQTQLSERKTRLVNVGSAKEYNAVEKELEALQKSAEQTEEELLQMVEVIETTESSTGEKEQKIVELRESITQDEANAGGALTDLDGKIQALHDETRATRDAVSKRIMYKYDFIRSRRPGSAIVAAKDGHCEGCFMALPPQLYIEIQRGDALQVCPSCQRILYFWEGAGGTAEEGEGAQEAEAAAQG